jgi:hypothetical protein
LVEGTPDVLSLRVADLDLEGAVYSPGRDPFSYGRPPAPDRPPPPPAQQRRPQQNRRQQPPKQTAAPARRQPPQVDVTVLGSFGRQEDRIAVFLDGSDIINAKIGEIVKDKFIVDAIGYESADLAFVGFPEAPSARLPAGGPNGPKSAGG